MELRRLSALLLFTVIPFSGWISIALAAKINLGNIIDSHTNLFIQSVHVDTLDITPPEVTLSYAPSYPENLNSINISVLATDSGVMRSYIRKLCKLGPGLSG